jgi:hypothetical protein
MQLAHRIAYKLTKGNIPNNLNVLHTCDNTSCVNPNHLYLGTQKQNAQDAVIRNRYPNRKGEFNPQVKLTKEQVLEIKATPRVRGSGVVLANKFGVSTTKIAQIRNNKAWSHV